MSKSPRHRRPLIEVLEPRLLFSATADIAVFDDGNSDAQYLAQAAEHVDLASIYLQDQPLMMASQQDATDVAALDAQSPTTSNITAVVFVDPAVKDFGKIIDDIKNHSDASNIAVIYLDPQQDGVEQITSALSQYHQLNAIHIISHGNTGAVELGNAQLNGSTLFQYEDDLAAWGKALGEAGDILLYGCDIAADPTGQALIDSIARLTDADVAASKNVTGHQSLDGDWDLEYRVGEVNTAVLASAELQQSFVGVMASTHFINIQAGTTAQAVSSTTGVGQSFLYDSPGATYLVNQISVQLRLEPGAINQDITIQLLDGGWNDATPLASQTFNSNALDGTFGWYTVNFGSVTLNDSQTYIVKITTNNADGKVSVAYRSDTWNNSEMIVNGTGNSANDLNILVSYNDANNQAPVNTVPGPQSVVMNTPFVFSNANGNRIQIADADAFPNDVEVTLTTNQGSFSLAQTTGLIFSNGDGTSDFHMIFRGSVSEVNAALATITYTPVNNFTGTDTFSITTKDLGLGGGLQDQDNITLNIAAVNNAPVINSAIANQTALKGVFFSYTFANNAFTDPNGDTLTYTATQYDGSALPAWLSFNAAARTFSGTPPDAYAVGNHVIRITASDGKGGTVTDDFVLTVSNKIEAEAYNNSSGVIKEATTDVGGGQNVGSLDAGDWVSYFWGNGNQIVATSGQYTFEWRVASNTGGSFGFTNEVGSVVYDTIVVPNTGGWQNWVTITKTINIDQQWNYSINGYSGNPNINWFQLTPNDTPVVVRGLADQTVNEESPFSYQFSNTQGSNIFEDSDALTFSATLVGGGALPAWLTFDPATRTFSGTPANGDVSTINVRVTATDVYGASNYDDFSVTVVNTQDPPVLANPIPNQTTAEEAFFNFQFAANTFVDPDLGDTLTYVATKADGSPLPAWLSFNAGTRTFSGVPDDGDVGTISIKVIASDGNGGVVEDTFDLTVTNVNDAPFVNFPVPNQNASEDAPFTYIFPANTFGDGDLGTVFTYTAELAGGGALPAWLHLDSATRTFSGTPANGDVGTISIRLIANDGAGGTVSDTFDIVIANTNDAPTVANAIPDQNATQGAAFNFQFAANTFNDIDVGDTLTYTAQLAGGGALPAWLVFDPVTRTFSGTPANADVGTISIDVTANDGNGGTVTDTFNIVIANTNDAPTIANAIPDQNATQDAAFNFQFAANTFNDIDVGDTLTYSAQLAGGGALPAWLVFDPVTRTFSGTPANADVGTISIDVTASDGNGGTVTDTFNIVIANTNDAPTVANAIPNQNATQGAAFNFQFAANTFNDIDVGDTLTYSAQLAGGGALPAWLVFDPVTRTFSGTPANADVGTISIDVTANDGNGGTVTDTFNIVIANTNDAPTIANAIPDQNATQDAAFNFQFAANTFNDIDVGDTLTYSAQLAGGGALPAWLVFDPVTRTFSGTPANADVGTISIDVTASDGNGGTVTDTFNIVIANTNDAPTIANAIPDQNATQDAAFNFQFAANTFNDIDAGDTLTYTAQLAGGGALPAWLVFDPVTRTFSGTPANADVGTISIDVTASDGNGGTVTDTFNIVIANTNDAPTVANAIPNQNATQGAAFNFQFAANTFNDIDAGDTLTYTAQLAGGGALPAWLVFDPVTRTFSGTPANADVGTISIDVTANDGNGGTVTDTFNIVIANTNDAPTVANAIPDQNATQGAAFNFQFAANTFNDIDAGDTLTYTAQLAGGGALPAWLVFDPVTRTFSGTPANADVGTISIDVTANDGNGGTVTDTFNIVIANTNDAPTVANAIPNQNATQGAAFNFQFAANTFNDIDVGDTLTYSAQLAGGGALPAWLVFDPVTRTFSGTPANADVGTISIDVTANDGNGGTITDTFTLVVANANDAPTVANAIPNQNATEDTAFNFTFAANTFNDIDVGDTLTYSAQLAGGGALPAWLVFDPVTRTFSGTPANADVGTISIDVTASDGNGGTVTDTFNIVIANANDAPTVANAIPDQNATQGAAFNFQFAANTFNDIDVGDTLTYSAQLAGGGALPAWLVFDPVTRTFSGTPANADVGTLSIDVTANDGNGGTITDTFTLVVANANDAPTVANAIPNQNATQGAAFNFQFAANTFNDIDVGDTLTYSAQLAGGGALPAWLVFDPVTRTFSGTPANADVGTISIDVTANDGNGGTVTDTFNIVIANTNDAPTVANAIPDQNATQGAAFNFQFAANTFNDIDVGDTLTYTAQLAGGGALPAWLVFDPVTRTFSGTPANADVGTISIDVTASDGNGGTVTDTFNIVIANTNDAPTVANAIPNQNATQGAAFNFQFAANTFNDIDVGDTLTYSAQLAGGGALPAWLVFDPVTRTFSGTPANADVGTISIDVTANDGNGGTVTDTFNIVIANTNDAPTVANAIPDQNATQGAAFNFQFAANTFNDIDVGDTLTYTAQLAGGGALPAWLVFDPVTRTFSGTPANADVGTISIDVTASDGNGGTVTDTFSLVIANANDAPTIANAISDQNATQDAAFNFQFAANTFNDIDAGDTLTYTAQLAGGGALPAWLVFDPVTRTFSGTPANADVGTISIDVTASDGNGGTITDTFNIVIANANDAPTVTITPTDYYANEQQTINLHGTGISVADVDGDPLTITLSGAGAGSELTASVGTTGVVISSGNGTNTLVLTGTAAQLNNLFAGNNGSTLTYRLADDTPPATTTLTITASDGSLSGNDTATINIAAVNDAPTNTVPGAQSTNEDTALVFNAGNSNHIQISDVDAGAGTLEITLSVTNGTLTLGSFAGLTFTTGDGTADSTMVFTGTLADLNAALTNLTFSPTANFSGGAVLSITTNDQGNTGSGGTLTATDTVNITVNAVNDAPTVASPLVDQNAVQGTPFSFTFGAGTFTDAELDALTYSAQLAGGGSLPSWLTFNQATRTFSGTPANGDVGTISIEVTANDGNGGTVTDVFDITVANINDAPTVAIPLPDRVATEASLFNFQFNAGTFSDVDAGDTLTYSATLSGGAALPAWLVFDPATRTFSGVPGVGDIGVLSIDVTAEDSSGTTVTDTFTLAVNAIGDIEYINTGGGGTQAPLSPTPIGQSFLYNSVGATYTVNEVGLYLARYTDAAVQTITVELRDGWNGAVLGTASISSTQISGDGFGWHTFSFGNVSLNDSQTYVIQVSSTGTDDKVLFSRLPGNVFPDGAYIENGVPDATGWDLAFKIAKDDGNNTAPILDYPIADQTIDAEAPFNLVMPANTFSDPDPNDTITYRAQLAGGGSMGWLQFNEATKTFWGTPHWHQAGTITVELIATDNHGASTSTFFDIEVINTNINPTVNQAIPNQTVNEDSPLNFQFDINTFADVDVGQTFTYTAELAVVGGMPPWLSFDAATRTFSGTPANGDVGTWTIEVTANDGFGGEVVETFDIVVVNTNDAPVVANPLPDQSATETSAFTFTFNSNTFNDEDVGDVLTYTATSNSGALPSWLTFNSATRTFTGTPPVGTAGTLNIEVTANDGNGGLISDSFIITIAPQPPNILPIVQNPIIDQSVNEYQAFAFTLPATTFVDPDGDTLGYSAQLVGGGALPSWLVFDAATGTFSGTPTASDIGSITVQVTATDSRGGSVSDSFVIAINNVNDAPVLAITPADQTAVANSPFSVTFPANMFTDADAGTVLTYTATLANGAPLPDWLVFDTATLRFSGTPTNADAGSITIQMTASDGIASASASFQLAVKAVNEAPQTSGTMIVQNLEDAAGDQVDLWAMFSDAETASKDLVYTVLSNSNPSLVTGASIDPVTGKLQLNYGANQFGTSELVVRAQDEQGAWVDNLVRITIESVNDIPVSNGIADIRVNAGSSPQQMNLSNVVNDIENGTNLTWSLVGNTNSNVATSIQMDPATGMMTISFASTIGGESTITLRTWDADGAWVDTSFKVIVAASPVTPPVVPPVTPPVIPPIVEPPVEPPVIPPVIPPVTPPVTPPTTPPTSEIPDTKPPSGSGDDGDNTGIEPPGLPGTGQTLIVDSGDESLRPDTNLNDKSSRDIARAEEMFKADATPVTTLTASTTLAGLIAPDSGFAPWEEADFDSEVRRLRAQMDEAMEEEQDRRAVVAGITFSITTGLLVWSLRASSLLLTMMSMLPLWRGLDPLPILDEVNKKKKELEQQRKDREREDKNAKEVGYLFDHAQRKESRP